MVMFDPEDGDYLQRFVKCCQTTQLHFLVDDILHSYCCENTYLAYSRVHIEEFQVYVLIFVMIVLDVMKSFFRDASLDCRFLVMFDYFTSFHFC
jgi:hypothetical protein